MKKAAELGLTEAQHNLADFYNRQSNILKMVFEGNQEPQS
jgi:TPR repeat protein